MNKKNKIKIEGKSFELTKSERFNINYWITYKKNKHYKLPTIIPISKRIHLDFIGWDNPDFMDVLICKTKKMANIKLKIDD